MSEQQMQDRLDRLEQAIAAIQKHLELEVTVGPQAETPLPAMPATPSQPEKTVAPTMREKLVESRGNKPAEQSSGQPAYSVPKPTPKPSSASKTSGLYQRQTRLVQPEYMLSILGVGLLLFGLAFLFKYAIDQGWLTPPIRLAFGYAVGLTLLGASLRLHQKRVYLSQLLAGGSVGAFYITTFAGYFLLQRLPYSLSFGLMTATTLLAYILSVWKRQHVLAVVGLVGGLATPFVLPTESNNIAGLLAYSAFVVSGALTIYYSLRWSYLLVMASLGSWAIYLLAFGSSMPYPFTHIHNEFALYGGAIFNWLAFGLVPFARHLHDVETKPIPQDATVTLPWFIPFYAVVTPLAATGFINTIWLLNQESYLVVGTVYLAVSGLYIGGAVSVALRWPTLRVFSHAFYLVGAIMLFGATSWYFGEHTRLMSYALLATGLQFFAMRWQYRMVGIWSHLLFVGQAIYILNTEPPQYMFQNMPFVAALVYLSGVVAVTLVFKARWIKYSYWLAAQVLLMFVIDREFASLNPHYPYHLNFLSWFVIGWLVYAIGHFSRERSLSYQALVSLTVTVFSMLIIDYQQQLLWTHVLFALTAVQLLILVDLDRKATDVFVRCGWTAITLVLAWWMLVRFNLYADPPAFLTTSGLVHGAAIISLAVLTRFVSPKEQLIYGLVAHLLMLGWLVVESQHLAQPIAFISVFWGIYAIAIIAAGFILRHREMWYVGLVTMLLVVAKLFLIDLGEVPTLWRILLFIGFGIILLVISYFVPKIWRTEEE